MTESAHRASVPTGQSSDPPRAAPGRRYWLRFAAMRANCCASASCSKVKSRVRTGTQRQIHRGPDKEWNNPASKKLQSSGTPWPWINRCDYRPDKFENAPYVVIEVRLGQSHNNRKARKDSRLSVFFTDWTVEIQTLGSPQASKGHDKGRKAIGSAFDHGR